MSKNQGHIIHIESIRAIAALMVLLFHFIYYYNGDTYLVSNETVRDWSTFGAQGVEMFYIISGYVMSLSLSRKNYTLRNYPKYLLKRGLRILPLYWSVVGIILIIQLVWKVAPDWNNFLANLTFSVDAFEGTYWLNPVFSTLGVEVQFYILFGLVFTIFRANRGIKYGIMVLWILAGYFTPEVYSVLSAAPFFAIGILLFDFEKEKNWLDFGGIGVIVLILAFLGYYQDVAIVFITLILFLLIKPTWKPLTQLGAASYSIYLTHGIFGGWFLFFCTKEQYGNYQSPWLILFATIISVLGAFVIYWFIEKRTISWSKSVGLKEKT